MVKKSMNPTLIIVVVVLLVLVCVVLYTNTKESYTDTSGLTYDHSSNISPFNYPFPYTDRDNWNIQCRLPGIYHRIPRQNNDYVCLPKNNIGRNVWHHTRSRVINKLDDGMYAHLFNIYDFTNRCRNNEALICTSEPHLARGLLNRMRPRGPTPRQTTGPPAGPRAGPRGTTGPPAGPRAGSRGTTGPPAGPPTYQPPGPRAGPPTYQPPGPRTGPGTGPNMSY